MNNQPSAITIIQSAAAVQPLAPQLPYPYTLAQVMANLETMCGTKDLSWCHWVAGDICSRGIDAVPAADCLKLTCQRNDLLRACKLAIVNANLLRNVQPLEFNGYLTNIVNGLESALALCAEKGGGK